MVISQTSWTKLGAFVCHTPHRSQFHHCVARLAKGNASSAAIRVAPQKSIQVALKEQAATDMARDVGLLPGTFVMPTGAAKPSFFGDPLLRWKIEVYRLKTRLQNLRGVLTYKYAVKGRPFPKLARRRIIPTATALHKQMYIAFVENDIATLSSICTEGLLGSLKARMALRPHNETQRWTLHRYTHRPRIVSDQAGMLQVKGAAVRQVIVRIRSMQSLVKGIKTVPPVKTKIIEGTDKAKVMNEYFVLQRRIWKGQEEPWMIWEYGFL